VTVAATEDPETARVKSGFWPVPESSTLCGLPGALSVMLSVAVLDPASEGVKVRFIAQLAPAPRELPQAFVSA
jgi:hypothetical protein